MQIRLASVMVDNQEETRAGSREARDGFRLWH
jgi:hypothetical protein